MRLRQFRKGRGSKSHRLEVAFVFGEAVAGRWKPLRCVLAELL